MAVAFAKLGPLLRMEEDINRWLAWGRKIEVIWGINQRGTSREALEFALEHFNKTYILFAGESFTFHPKMYLFCGLRKCCFYVGSHNLTVGGTETNWEAGFKLDVTLPEDEALINDMLAAWNSLVPSSARLTRRLLSVLAKSGLLLDEGLQKRRAAPGEAEGIPMTRDRLATLFPRLQTKPPSALPRSAFAAPQATIRVPTRRTVVQAPRNAAAKALVIQIVPHRNGEVFLSKIAINQNPSFFGYPFTGATTPKKPTNPSYPQREPDPVVNITVFDSLGEALTQLRRFALNTVYYRTKAEIRITVPPGVVRNTPAYSILVIRQAPDEANHDYDMEIFPPGSSAFEEYLGVCNQSLPSGGKNQARRMGWL
jgi:hypothetical protein